MSAASNQPFQIVLAEDNPADVMLVRMALRDGGLNCALTVVEDGEKALRLIEQLDQDSKALPIDLLLLDLHLPKHDGADILKRLRSSERNALAPVIVMTASQAPQDYEMAQKHAAIHYFQKPASLAGFMQLGAIVHAVLTGQKTGAKGISDAQARGGAA